MKGLRNTKRPLDLRLPLMVFTWVQFWVAVPRLSHELPIPGLLGHHYLWNRIWAALLLPALFSFLSLAATAMHKQRLFPIILSAAGIALNSVYLMHYLPPSYHIILMERWLAAALSLAAAIYASHNLSDKRAPGVEILSAVSLLLAFAAASKWALVEALFLFLTSVLLGRPQSPNR